MKNWLFEKSLWLGILFLIIPKLIISYFVFPDAVNGFFFGLGLVFIIVGLNRMRHLNTSNNSNE